MRGTDFRGANLLCAKAGEDDYVPHFQQRRAGSSVNLDSNDAGHYRGSVMSAYANTYLIEQQAGIDWGTVLPPMSSLYTQEQPVVSVSTACREIHQYEQDRPEPAADRERELALVRATY